MWQGVPKLVYAFWTLQPMIRTAFVDFLFMSLYLLHRVSSRGNSVDPGCVAVSLLAVPRIIRCISLKNHHSD